MKTFTPFAPAEEQLSEDESFLQTETNREQERDFKKLFSAIGDMILGKKSCYHNFTIRTFYSLRQNIPIPVLGKFYDGFVKENLASGRIRAVQSLEDDQMYSVI